MNFLVGLSNLSFSVVANILVNNEERFLSPFQGSKEKVALVFEIFSLLPLTRLQTYSVTSARP